MKHKSIKSLIGAYLDGELQGNLKKIVEDHLKVCPECSEELRLLKALNSKVKAEKIAQPADVYWDNFPKRVMEKLKEEKRARSFLVRIPRIKWELAGGLVLILLTFIVSKQIIMEKARRVKPVAVIHKAIEGKKVAPGEGFLAKDEEKRIPPPISSDKSAIKIVGTASKTTELSNVAGKKIGGVATSAGLKERPLAIKKESLLAESEEIKKSERKEIDILAEIKEKEDYLKTSKDAVKARDVKKRLLKLYYIEAEKSRRRDDIERALKEINIYKDSFPEKFRDTLLIFNDSLRIMMEEIEKDSKQ